MRCTTAQTPASSQGNTEGPSLSYRLLSLMLAITYGGFLASLPLKVFSDRTSYLNYAAYSWDILNQNWSHSPLVALANEPLWLLINSCLAYFLPVELTLRVIIFVPAAVVAWIVLQQSPRKFVWLVLILLFPAVIRNHITALREGMALAVFLLGWFSKSKPLRWLAMGCAPFIHSSFFFVLGLLGLARMALKLHLGPDLRTLLFAATGIFMGLLVGRLSSLLGARQASEYNFTMAENASGLGFIFWALVLVVMCLQGRCYMRLHAFELGTILFYLSTYFFIEISARIFESSLLLVLLAGLQLTGWRRAVFLMLILCLTALQYARQYSQPWLGWGIQ
jgi:hypothetical protein